jgi:hypothetical protein
MRIRIPLDAGATLLHPRVDQGQKFPMEDSEVQIAINFTVTLHNKNIIIILEISLVLEKRDPTPLSYPVHLLLVHADKTVERLNQERLTLRNTA